MPWGGPQEQRNTSWEGMGEGCAQNLWIKRGTQSSTKKKKVNKARWEILTAKFYLATCLKWLVLESDEWHSSVDSATCYFKISQDSSVLAYEMVAKWLPHRVFVLIERLCMQSIYIYNVSSVYSEWSINASFLYSTSCVVISTKSWAATLEGEASQIFQLRVSMWLTKHTDICLCVA